MALHDIEKIGTVTKTDLGDGYLYQFEEVTIRTVTASNYLVRRTRGMSDSQEIRLSDVANNFGASTIEAYADALAEAGYFSTSNAVPIGSRVAESGDGLELTNTLDEISSKLDAIIFLLKIIAQ